MKKLLILTLLVIGTFVAIGCSSNKNESTPTTNGDTVTVTVDKIVKTNDTLIVTRDSSK